MILLTRKVECPGGAANTTAHLAGFLASRPAWDVALKNCLGWDASELVVDTTAGTITREGVVVATLVDV